MENNCADVVVVGAGIAGTAAAYYLSKAGLKVALVEKGDIASGSSGSCDAEICSIDHNPGYDANLSIMSNRMYQRLVEELDWDFEYRQYGTTILIETETELEFMQKRMAEHMRNWIPVTFIEAKDLYKQEPLLGPGILGAIDTRVDAACQSMQVCVAFSRTARKRYGLVIRTHEQVKGIRLERGKVSAVVTDKGEIRTPRVVNCCGAWAPQLGEMAGLKIPIEPRKGHIVVVEPSAPLLSHHMQEARYTVSKFHPELAQDTSSDVAKYGVAFTHEPTHSGTTLIGSARQFVGFDFRPDWSVVNTIMRRAIRFIPALKDLHCIRTYCGLRPYTPDHFPIVSPVDEVPGYFVNAGAEGDGIGIGPLTGLLTTQLMLGHEPIVDPRPLRWSRFAEAGERENSKRGEAN